MSHSTLFVCGLYDARTAPAHARAILGRCPTLGKFTGGASGCYFNLKFASKKEALAAQSVARGMGYEVSNWDEWVLMNATTTFRRMSESKGVVAATAWLNKTFPKVAARVLASSLTA